MQNMLVGNKPRGRKTRTTVPKLPDCDVIDHGHFYHQGTQTTLLTVDLTDALPRSHMYDQLASTWLQSNFSSAPSSEMNSIDAVLQGRAKENFRARVRLHLEDLQSWAAAVAARLG
jgi:hypothetical protein